GVRDGPERVAPRLQLLALHQYILRKRDRGGRVSAGVPDLAPGNQLAEEFPAAGHGAVVDDGDRVEAHDLPHPAVLAEGDAFLGPQSGWNQSECGEKDSLHHFSLGLLPANLSPLLVSDPLDG